MKSLENSSDPSSRPSLDSPVPSLAQPQARQHQGDAYLKFDVCAGVQAGMSMNQVQEVLVLPGHHLTPMPNLPAGVLGLMHRRSRVLWVVDLARLLGVGAMEYSPQQYDVVMIQAGGPAIAAAVRKVEGITWVQPNQVQPLPSHVTKGLLPYSRGCLLQEQSMTFLLDGEAILQAPMLQVRSL